MEIKYNSQQKKLVLPEYGRNVQQMVDHCVGIEDREERNRCARTIVQIMGNLVPQLRDAPDFSHKLWDHLAIMSDFKLDIDYPYELLHKENLATTPERVGYTLEPIRMRHYGKIIERMIDVACQMEQGEERDVLVSLIANHMKKLMVSLNKEGVEDDKIFKDLCAYSRGKINLDTSTCQLHEFKEAPAPAPSGSKKSKKKKG